MTTFNEETVKCAVCGETNKRFNMESTSILGSPDMDMRPAEMKRSTIGNWVYCCSSCGYCAPDLSEDDERNAAIVETVGYQDRLKNKNYSQLANRFRCYAQISESYSNFDSGGWAYLHAAWVCDDEQNEKGAITCRKNSARLFQITREQNQQYNPDKDTEDAIMIDVLRRSGQFEEALSWSKKVLQRGPSETIVQIMEFQRDLINKNDLSCYTIEDAKAKSNKHV
jgi:hypothetical protein